MATAAKERGVEREAAAEAFLLTQDWEDAADGCRAVLCGASADGPVEARVPVRPVFFVRRTAAMPGNVAPVERRAVELADFDGAPVDALYFRTQREARAARETLRAQRLAVYESDIAPSDRFLMEHFIHGSLRLEGACRRADGVRVFDDPRVRAADAAPPLALMSLDIETGRGGELYSAAYQFRGRDGAVREQVYVAGERDAACGPAAAECRGEAGALDAFLADVRRLDPDLLIGWNVIAFDLRFLERACARLGVRFALGRRGCVPRLAERGGGTTIHVHGRAVVDGPPALRAAFFAFEDYSLNSVAAAVLGASKDIEAHGAEKIEEIERRYREDRPALAHYNLLDCRLVTGIFDRLGLVEHIVSRVRITGLPIDRLGRSVRAFDHIYLPRLHRRGVVAPDIDAVPRGTPAPGGLVLPPRAGLYGHVVVLDFRSLYPSVIRTFKIDPLARLRAGVAPRRTPDGAAFSSTEHILPDYIEELMARRAAARRAGDENLSQAVKILMNSFYGVMGTPNCRFYHPDLPRSITGTGQWVLKAARDRFESQGYRVLYGDTDSLFLALKPGDVAAPHAAGRRLAAEATAHLAERLRDGYGVASALELAFETYYRKLFLPPVRGRGEAGACKRYAGLACDEGGHTTLEFTGLEAVRTDWTPLARAFQRELFRRYFAGEPLDDWLRGVVADLRAGRLDGQLVYRKRIRKPLAGYVRATPPHVRAARLLPAAAQADLRAVSYVITQRGPVPTALPHGDLDYDHYLERQLKPIADAVLEQEGRAFDAFTGPTQLPLL